MAAVATLDATIAAPGATATHAVVVSKTKSKPKPKTTTMTTTSSSSSIHTKRDLELRLLQAFSDYAMDTIVSSYLCVKRSSRFATVVMTTTERILTKSGLVTLVGMLFGQFQRVGHPWLQGVDAAMGNRIVDVFVRILLLAEEQHDDAQASARAIVDLEAGNELSAAFSGSLGRLSYQERIQALLQGEIPRVEMLLEESKRREMDALQQVSSMAPVVMELKDFVPVDEVKRMNDASKERMQEKTQEVAALRAQLLALEREKQRLEQDLTDVHNYQETERGQRFAAMEVRKSSVCHSLIAVTMVHLRVLWWFSVYPCRKNSRAQSWKRTRKRTTCANWSLSSKRFDGSVRAKEPSPRPERAPPQYVRTLATSFRAP